MPEGIAIERGGWRTLLKWHRGRKQAGDIAFTGARIAEGLSLGASVEIDLQRQAGGGFVVLHDQTLERETTGIGAVADALPDYLERLRLRDNDGNSTEHVPMLLGDLARLLAEKSGGDGAILQLDMKNDAIDLTNGDVKVFAETMAPVLDHIILSCGDAALVKMMRDALPKLGVGYDPCHFGAVDAVLASSKFARFVVDAVAAMPHATMIYLEARLVLEADRRGFNLVEAFHNNGKTIDAYTIRDSNVSMLPDVLRLLDLRCDQITTDDPIGLERLVMTATA